jgi:hypothetical protein
VTAIQRIALSWIVFHERLIKKAAAGVLLITGGNGLIGGWVRSIQIAAFEKFIKDV